MMARFLQTYCEFRALLTRKHEDTRVQLLHREIRNSRKLFGRPDSFWNGRIDVQRDALPMRCGLRGILSQFFGNDERRRRRRDPSSDGANHFLKHFGYMQRFVLENRRPVEAEAQIWSVVTFHRNSIARAGKPRKQVCFSETVKVDDEIESPAPDIADQSRHVAQRR